MVESIGIKMQSHGYFKFWPFFVIAAYNVCASIRACTRLHVILS